MSKDPEYLLRQAIDETKTLIVNGNNDDPPRDQPFHTRVKLLRTRLKLTQDQFAEHYGLNAATVKNWEQGRRKNVGAAAEVLIKMIEKDPEGMSEKAMECI